ncbi:LLM class flavin-dependent oxidoreductase [Actinoplanes sp. TRM 88003]|uniref:LLM class flavin-dependent oxidoreductase n=1 Tax=Paractinoplanes aksuensis TaxID=2939490 RepID=A0ABT1DFT4_9ACTN|nr:LLM class flavin-dependent oxidoreductase [Actinoplanes aksuensis]MCO8269688.1 LLM class flavin-dependent oxidoreductase [Actinoplanes aksuensis]
MGLKYAVGLPTVGAFGDVRRLVELGVAAERHGWDGVHLWDHLLYHEPDWPVTNTVVAASAIAARTERVRIIVTVVLPRRPVQDVAQETAALNVLSGGRLTVLPIIGSLDREFTDFGLDADPRTRGRALDEGIEQLIDLWAEWGAGRIPIWCGGMWPNRPGLRRAARFDGAMPLYEHQRDRNVPLEEFAATVAYVREESARHQRLVNQPYDFVLEGATDAATAVEQTAPYAKAGLTWWIEAFGYWRGGPAVAADRIAQGPTGV